MKTAVSLPEPLFHWFEALAKRKNISRSKLYAAALSDYQKRLSADDLTEQANRYADEINHDLGRAVHRSGLKAWKELD